ncbi:MAG: hypothetical protein M3R17_02495, partial [Bacteroidota bacterium]|nr:hypothetical protein [Bacteroidota bacterium]
NYWYFFGVKLKQRSGRNFSSQTGAFSWQGSRVTNRFDVMQTTATNHKQKFPEVQYLREFLFYSWAVPGQFWC